VGAEKWRPGVSFLCAGTTPRWSNEASAGAQGASPIGTCQHPRSQVRRNMRYSFPSTGAFAVPRRLVFRDGHLLLLCALFSLRNIATVLGWLRGSQTATGAL
jgi:hypothetical protein